MAKFEEILADYRRYKELLFQLSPPEWQEAHGTNNKKDKGNFKTKGIGIITRTKNDPLNDVIWFPLQVERHPPWKPPVCPKLRETHSKKRKRCSNATKSKILLMH